MSEVQLKGLRMRIGITIWANIDSALELDTDFTNSWVLGNGRE